MNLHSRKTSYGSVRPRNLLLGSGIIVLVVAAFFLLPRILRPKVEKSVAVLPFENLSGDKELDSPADEIWDDVLTKLTKVRDLKVISRRSVDEYEKKERNLGEIGRVLGVSAILEGSVNKAGNSERVDVRLVSAATEKQIWTKSYDRDATDAFLIPSDLAQEVASRLHVKMSRAEKARMIRRPTENNDAYDDYVGAHHLHTLIEAIDKLRQPNQDADSSGFSIVVGVICALYERALKNDPNFAVAAADFSRLQSGIFHSYEPATAWKEKARASAERALSLQPDLPEGHLALGFSYYYGDSNYDKAMKEFQAAEEGWPNNAAMRLAIGDIQRRQGKWEQSNENLVRAIELSPNETAAMEYLAENYAIQRNFNAATEIVDRALKLEPNSFRLLSTKSEIELADKGTFTSANQLAKYGAGHPMPKRQKARLACVVAQTLLMQRKYAEALQMAEGVDDALTSESQFVQLKYSGIGLARKLMHDDAGAQEAFLKLKEKVEKAIQEAPNDPKPHSTLAQVLAWLGEKDAAIAEGKRATEILPESVDAFEGPELTAILAQVYALVGEQDKALDLIDGLLSRPSPLTVAMLRIHPAWDSLRENPRFINLLKK